MATLSAKPGALCFPGACHQKALVRLNVEMFPLEALLALTSHSEGSEMCIPQSWIVKPISGPTAWTCSRERDVLGPESCVTCHAYTLVVWIRCNDMQCLIVHVKAKNDIDFIIKL